MKPPSRNKALLAELKKSRELLPTPEPAARADIAPIPSTPAAAQDAARIGGYEASEAFSPQPASEPGPAPAAMAVAKGDDEAWPPALAAQIGENRWTRSGLLAALASSLPPDFPAIRLGGVELCPRGTYRALSRSRGGTAVCISSAGGVHELTPIPGSAAYRRWVDHLTRHRAADPQGDAARLSCAELVDHLEDFGDYQRETWTKTIDAAAWMPAEKAGTG